MTRACLHDIIYDNRVCRVINDAVHLPVAAASKDGGGANMYAIIKTGGKQYKVSEGDTLFVEKLGVATFGQISALMNVCRGAITSLWRR